jgi:WD40 repeat protein
MDPAFKGKKKEYKEEEDDDYAVAVLEEMGIPPTDPAWYDVLSESYNYHNGIGVCLNMIRLNHAIISLAFHPSGEILAVASGSTLHLWDYDEEGRRRKKKRKESLNAGGQPQRESESRILYRDRNSDFPASRTVDLRHESALRCVHFPPCGKTLIIGGVNPQSANEGLVHRHPRGRGGMSGGGMSFHLRLWDFDLEAILDADGGSSNMGGSVTDEGEVTWNIIGGKKALSDVSCDLDGIG